MEETVYSLFAECFPQLGTAEDIFRREGGIPAGCAAVSENCIRLLCVRPDFRNRGIGRGLLH